MIKTEIKSQTKFINKDAIIDFIKSLDNLIDSLQNLKTKFLDGAFFEFKDLYDNV